MKPDRLTRFLHDKARIVPAFVDQSMRDLYTQRSCTLGPFRTSQSRRQEVRLAADDVLGRRHLDDPAAIPEWTGCCGTDRGYHLHRAEHLPMCSPCQGAHEDWLAEHRHLCGGQLSAAVTTARSRAIGRGAALAENARELRAQQLTWPAICQRLGVNQVLIEATLRRHELAVRGPAGRASLAGGRVRHRSPQEVPFRGHETRQVLRSGRGGDRPCSDLDAWL
ncbi:hypothetical protein O1L55_34520 [Streptomyces albulus]|nr:hypothetical protein [Streptomyces noursei]